MKMNLAASRPSGVDEAARNEGTAVRRLRGLSALLLPIAGISFSACGGDSLGSSLGELKLELCDRGEACGCGIVEPSGTVIDFGSPEPGETARRNLALRNANPGNVLEIRSVTLDDDTGAFGIIGVQLYDGDRAVASVDFANGPLALSGNEYAEVILGFEPAAAGRLEAAVRVLSDSNVQANWNATLRGGGGSSEVCVPDGSCEADRLVDFGTYQDSVVQTLAQEERLVTVRNTGESEVFVTVELVDDGIPETRPNEQPGEVGVFALGELPCTAVLPGETLEIPVLYRPFVAGEHRGAIRVGGIGDPVEVELLGRVVGARVCFETGDSVPNDATLQFGDPPTFNTPTNAPETRAITARNCGYEADLIIDAVTALPGSSTEFSSPSLPWSSTTLAVGESTLLEVSYGPTGAPGTPSGARWEFSSNDVARPNALIELSGRSGPAERCVLVPSENPIDFGWAALNEAGGGVTCPPGFPFCPGLPGDDQVTRTKTIALVNIGARPCTDIELLPIVPSSAQQNFAVTNNPNGAGFNLAPGASSQPIELLFAAALSTNPIDYFGRLPYTSPDLAFPQLEIPLVARGGGSPNCQLEFSPVNPGGFFCAEESLAFGSVNIGQEKTINLRIRNIGSDTCEITNIRGRGNTTTFFSFPTQNISLPVGDSTFLPVTFAPVPPSGNNPFEEIPILCGTTAIEMSVNSGPMGAVETDSVSLSGTGTRPDIDVIPGDLDFGEVTVGCCSQEERIAIYNSGDGTLSINELGILSTSDPGFTVTQPPADTELAPGESTELFVRYCASSESSASGVLEIESTDDNEEYFTVSLGAQGTTDSEGFDTYQQPQRPTVDVLWVIDDSGSMGDEQDDLANNFNSFISTAVSLDTDYHIGVVATDVESEWAGKLYHCNDSNRFIRDSQPAGQQEAQFRCWVKTADFDRPHSDGQEAPLQAARMALDYPNVDDYNAGFLRDEATLYVILVTDEPDQSNGPYELYVDFFQNLKGVGNPDLLNISAISGPPPDGCATAAENPYDFDAVNAVGGEFRSICTADWSDLINDLGLDVFNARRQFPLDRPATASTIEVRVCDLGGNCAAVGQDATSGWTFDAAANAVVFNGTAVPGPGETVEVEYVAICF